MVLTFSCDDLINVILVCLKLDTISTNKHKFFQQSLSLHTYFLGNFSGHPILDWFELSTINFGIPIIEALIREVYFIGMSSNFRFFKVFLNYPFISWGFVSLNVNSVHSCTIFFFITNAIILNNVLNIFIFLT